MKIVITGVPIERLEMPILDDFGGDKDGRRYDRSNISDRPRYPGN